LVTLRREVRLKILCLQIQWCIELLRVSVFAYYQRMCRGRDIREITLVDILLFYRLEARFFFATHKKNK
jgi:hypothetical protein